MKDLYDITCAKVSRLITRQYSTSFSLGIFLLDRNIRSDIYAIYAFVRCADEIVDSFHDYDQERLLNQFVRNYKLALSNGISTNPVLHSFQKVALKYNLMEEVEIFLNSMDMDLEQSNYQRKEDYDRYILGSAEVVGLMCLKVFSQGNDDAFLQLRPHAQSLGSAFQKVNFLRDLNMDFNTLGRIYFPHVNDINAFDNTDKKKIVEEVELEFKQALQGIRKLPTTARLGVYVAYQYYYTLLKKIKLLNAKDLLKRRIRISNFTKGIILVKSFIQYKLNAL